MKKLCIPFLTCAFLFSSVLPSVADAETSEPRVSVKLVQYIGNQKQIKLKVSAMTPLVDSSFVLKKDNVYIVKAVNGKVALYEGNAVRVTATTLKLNTAESTVTSINDRPYLGKMDFNVESYQFVRPVNHVLLETYLKGVVPREMSSSWNMEALKTQAVAARTYAYSYLQKVITDTTSYQAYGGYRWEAPTTKAVDDTYGQILTYQNQPITTFFSASNGGKIESNGNAWGGKSLPYLIAKNDPYDTKYNWFYTFASTQLDLKTVDVKNEGTWWNSKREKDSTLSTNLKNWLKKNGYNGKEIKITDIAALNFSSTLSSGRANKGSMTFHFVVKGDKNANGELRVQEKTMNGTFAQIKALFGTSKIKTNVVLSVTDKNGIMTINGKGEGHGVGMSQYGAKAMAEQGKKFQDILGFYYMNTSLTNAYTKTTNVTPPSTMPVPIKTPIPVPTTPVLSGVNVQINEAQQTVSVQYTTNKAGSTIVFVRDSQNEWVSTIQNWKDSVAGTYSHVWNTKTMKPGLYKVGIITKDSSGKIVTSYTPVTIGTPATPVR